MSYIDLRGGASAGVPVGNGVLKTMSDRTGLSFDLPTCAMSFVARSAGITTTWISPTSGTVTEYGWVQNNSAVNGTRKSHDVGLKNLITGVFMMSLETFGRRRETYTIII